jgi:undecaprenyl-diphosphatase
MQSLLELDQQLFLTLNNWGGATWDAFWIFCSGKLSWAPLYVVLLVLLFKKLSIQEAWMAVALLALLVLLADQGSVQLFKNTVQRLRPCHEPALSGLFRLPTGSCGGQFGFVSSHAANTFALAVFMGGLLRPYFKWIGPILLLWATLVALSRVLLGVHYPGDILGGAIWGALVARLLLLVFNRLQTIKKQTT